MGNKKIVLTVLNWQSTNPVTGFLPINNETRNGSIPSGVASGVMSGTNTIYSQIVEKSMLDYVGATVAWSGTPTGTLSVLVSNDGINFNALSFSPTLVQPAGSAAGLGMQLDPLPFKYLLFKYVNISGTGAITATLQMGDTN